MTFKFRKIPANDPLFLKVKSNYQKDHAYFEEYADTLTKKSGRAKDNKSGKGRSYANYLIRLVIFYQEFFGVEINNLLNFTTLKNLEAVVHSPNFKKYNDNENRFPNATFNCYVSCVTHLSTITEEEIDLSFNESFEKVIDNKSNHKINSTIEGTQKRMDKVKHGNVFTYPRKRDESLKAKKNSNWQCELNSNHTTFISNASRKPYIEAHHLIPMAAQDYFENTLDFADNIVSLCPNCHRKIHHAINEDKKEIVMLLFKKREKKYYKYGININFKKILNFYEVF